ncbi:Salicylate hydroxylase (Salicylate 1-monooxygenase) [Niveomyces insectorum RCEF 264]|uniref:Salicylate hydroxylase (Salicylate 1-monooxygenase) n=1 Tax=Niveomyces insectorum RCEF 264 TaxID=1081102 RepID=A0A167WEP5_9HYPO|nr:Salicylate hydroxylase (Salicylate 1-monooxygenase) [Niveomyces insectorum RCEF 264]
MATDTNRSNGAGPIQPPPGEDNHQIYGVYPTTGYKPSNKFYPIDIGYVPPEARGASPPLRIAIVGGGLAGAAAAGCLARLPNVDVKVYERSDAIREVGALIGVMVSGMKVLARMLSPANFDELQRICYRGENVDGINHRHWRTGEILTTAISPHTPRHLQEGRTSRVALHRVLMNEIPDEAAVFRYGKHVVRVEKTPREHDAHNGQGEQHDTNGPDAGSTEMKLHFADGGTASADVVVAADGLYSKLRNQYFPNRKVRYLGRVSYRHIVPWETIQHIQGLPKDTSSWRRNGEVAFMSPIGTGGYSFTCMVIETEEYAASLRWAKSIGPDGLRRLREHHFAEWDPIINEVLAAFPDMDAYPLEAAPWVKDLAQDDALAFVGDAAHPTAGGGGVGSSLAFADVRALYLSLWRSYNSQGPANPAAPPYDIPYALHLYNETRSALLQRVERQIRYDHQDAAYIAAAGDDEEEWIRRYRERFTINWFILEDEVDAKWQDVEAEERHLYPQKQKLANQNVVNGV